MSSPPAFQVWRNKFGPKRRSATARAFALHVLLTPIWNLSTARVPVREEGTQEERVGWLVTYYLTLEFSTCCHDSASSPT